MPTLSQAINGFVAANDFDTATLGRLDFWNRMLGHRELSEISPEEVDEALVRLAERGRLRPLRGRKTLPAGAPLKGSTVNRYVAQLASVYRFARRCRILPRAHVPPTRGLEREPERSDPNRYFREEELERLLAVAPMVDTRWGKFHALVTLLYTTGMRIGNALGDLTWENLDLQAGTAHLPRTKNGEPQVCALPGRTVEALSKLPKGQTP